MRTFPSFLVASLLALAPRLAAAQDAPPAVDPAPLAAQDAPPAPVTVVVIPPAATLGAYAPPVWQRPPTPDPVVMRRRSKGLMIGGLVMAPIGLALAIGGGVWAHDIQNRTSQCRASGNDLGAAIGAAFCGIGEGFGNIFPLTTAYFLAISGGIMTVSGTAMAIAGAQWVPAKPGWRPAVQVGAGTAKLAWSF